MDPLFAAACGVRAAIASRSFDEAGKLLGAYCDLVERTLRDMPPGDPVATEIEKRTQELFHWSNCMVRAARTHLCDQLLALPPVSPYQTSVSPAAHHWRIDA